MDQFGVLVERIGFKPHGKSAPLAQLKSNPQANPISNNGFPQNIGIPPMPDFVVADLDDIFYTQKKSGSGSSHMPNILDDNNTDILGVGGVSSSSNAVPQNQGIIGPESLFPFINSSNSEKLNSNDDLLTSTPWKTDGIHDLLHPNSTSAPGLQSHMKDNGSNAVDLIPGFGISTPSYEGWSDVKVSQPSSSHADDPFLVFEPPGDASWPFTESDWLPPNTGNVPVQNSVDDELERLGRATKIKKEETVKKSNMDNIFGMSTPKTSISKPVSKTKEPVFERPFPGGQKPASSTCVPKDFISLFEDDVNTSGAFKDRDGESDEQRRRRLNSHMRTQERMAQALAEKKQRDVQTLQEQEERSRLADTLDNKIKRWASGKESNLRALLSSLQDVLWPQSGWQTASLTDLMESKSVKKVYYRATLYLHPDKVQQKGFSPQQKYIAEKVFHVLKEAYKTFDAEELR